MIAFFLSHIIVKGFGYRYIDSYSDLAEIFQTAWIFCSVNLAFPLNLGIWSKFSKILLASVWRMTIQIPELATANVQACSFNVFYCFYGSYIQIK